MQRGDDVYALLSNPGPDLHVFVVREVRTDGIVAHEACCLHRDIFFASHETNQPKRVTANIGALVVRKVDRANGIDETFTMQHLLNHAHAKLGI